MAVTRGAPTGLVRAGAHDLRTLYAAADHLGPRPHLDNVQKCHDGEFCMKKTFAANQQTQSMNGWRTAAPSRWPAL